MAWKYFLFLNWAKLPPQLCQELRKEALARHLKKDETLFEIGDEGDGCYRLEKGALKVSLRSQQGEKRIVALLPAGSIVGDLSMIHGKPRSATVVALTPCDLTFFNRKTFERFAEKYPEVYRDLVNMLADRLRDCDEAIAASAFLPMRNRVARALLEFVECVGEGAPGGKVFLPRSIKQSDVAALAGVARRIRFGISGLPLIATTSERNSMTHRFLDWRLEHPLGGATRGKKLDDAPLP
jgi:CRP/FNR family transcriptional regulator, cyclic AMP receptor protein